MLDVIILFLIQNYPFFRSKLEPEPAGFIPFLAPGIDFRPESSPYFPKDFDIERPPHDGYAQAPRLVNILLALTNRLKLVRERF